MPNYSIGWVHREICARLMRFYTDVMERKSPRLDNYAAGNIGIARELKSARALLGDAAAVIARLRLTADCQRDTIIDRQI